MYSPWGDGEGGARLTAAAAQRGTCNTRPWATRAHAWDRYRDILGTMRPGLSYTGELTDHISNWYLTLTYVVWRSQTSKMLYSKSRGNKYQCSVWSVLLSFSYLRVWNYVRLARYLVGCVGAGGASAPRHAASPSCTADTESHLVLVVHRSAKPCEGIRSGL